jgi:hypothetical protein
MAVMRALPLLLTLALAGTAWCEDAIDGQVAATDMTNADQVFALAAWCRDHQHPVSARKYFNAVLKLDPDNEGARDALGFVRVGEKWVPKAFAPKGSGAVDAGAGQGPSVNAAPGPTADRIAWDDPIPADPEPTNAFISKYIDRLPSVANDSNDMDVSVATCIDRKYWPSALPRLCKALAQPSFTDLYGASMMALELGKQGRLQEARPLIGPMVKATSHVSDPEDLASFCWAVASFKDRRAVPRLIELMEQGPADLTAAATQAIATIARLPATGLDAAAAHRWWNENWNRSDAEAAKAQAGDKDPAVAVEAARELLEQRDRDAIPAAIRCLKEGDAHVRMSAIDIIAKATGDNWGYNPDGDAVARGKIVAHLETWWAENHATFHFPEPAHGSATPAATKDPCAELVSTLDRPEGTLADDAEKNLLNRRFDAAAALLDGLSSPSVIIRRRCHEILTQVTGATVAFDARGTDEQRAQAIAAWRAWFEQNHPLTAPPAPAPAPAPPQAGGTGATGAGDGGTAPPPHERQAPMGGMPGL